MAPESWCGSEGTGPGTQGHPCTSPAAGARVKLQELRGQRWSTGPFHRV